MLYNLEFNQTAKLLKLTLQEENASDEKLQKKIGSIQ